MRKLTVEQALDRDSLWGDSFYLSEQGRVAYDFVGVSRTGETVRFARLLPDLRQADKYLRLTDFVWVEESNEG